jgi:hypothetical protein
MAKRLTREQREIERVERGCKGKKWKKWKVVDKRSKSTKKHGCVGVFNLVKHVFDR